MTRVPVPRYDLLEMPQYLFGSVQFSRGCPFQCEFCDIIVTFGRRPRLKTPAQVIAELDQLLERRMEIVFIVDDNLIGNKKAIAPLLDAVRAWQEAHGFPFVFVTEASLDLAEDAELMRLMLAANILSVFIGIESPNEASLVETKKHQNVKAGRTLVERVRAVQQAGLEVWAGMIVGFDHDDETIFDAQATFLREAGIAQAMIGMLYAIPKTPLHARLAAEGRLDEEDLPRYGTNVVPARMSRQALRDGYVDLMTQSLRAGGVFRAPGGGPWPRYDAVCASASALLAPAPGRAMQRTSPQPGPRRRALCPADAPRRERGAAAPVSRRTLASATPVPGSGAAVRLRDSLRDALPPRDAGRRHGAAPGRRRELDLSARPVDGKSDSPGGERYCCRRADHSGIHDLAAAGHDAEVHRVAVDLGGHEGQVGVEAAGGQAGRGIDVAGPQLAAGSDHEVDDALLRLDALVEVVVAGQHDADVVFQEQRLQHLAQAEIRAVPVA